MQTIPLCFVDLGPPTEPGVQRCWLPALADSVGVEHPLLHGFIRLVTL